MEPFVSVCVSGSPLFEALGELSDPCKRIIQHDLSRLMLCGITAAENLVSIRIQSKCGVHSLRDPISMHLPSVSSECGFVPYVSSKT